MRSLLLICLGFGFALGLSFSLAGCAAGVDDEGASEVGSAASDIVAYEKVIRNGTSVENDTTPTAAQSASTKITGWIPAVLPEKVLARLLAVEKWTEITDGAGAHPFTHSTLVRQSGDGVTRTVAAKLTLDAGVDIDTKATTKKSGEDLTIRISNTSAYSHWFLGTVLLPSNLVIDVKLVPYKSGTIVQASMKVKLEAAQDRAAGVTQTLVPMFDWLKKTAR